MKRDGAAERALPDIMPGDVRDYLLTHPDFLEDNGDLLESLVPPVLQHGKGVEDFQRFMLERLQEHYAAIRGEHDDLMAMMQEHLQRQNRVNVAILSLLDLTDLASTVRFITRDVPMLLDQESVALFLEAEEAMQTGDYGGLQVRESGFVRRWLRDEDIELAEQLDLAPELFGESCGTVRSRALVRLYLGEGMPTGLMALGHREAMYYATGLATEQIECLGAVVERRLGRWLSHGSDAAV